MKKLVFNGCSFMAGDELVWEQFHNEYNQELTPWVTKSQLSNNQWEFRVKYITEYRKRFNLPRVVSDNMGCEYIDLSHDGKSNQNISIETIAFINQLPIEERKNCHVIIGWTSLSRILKYSKTSKTFVDLTSHHHKHSDDPVKGVELKEYIKARILDSDDEDFILDYVSNIMLLENYLIANNITYTFYRGLDDCIYNFKTIGPFTANYTDRYEINIDDCTNHSAWFNFSENSSTPINDTGWNMEFLNYPYYHVSPSNGHPNISAVRAFSARLAEFIKTQNVL